MKETPRIIVITGAESTGKSALTEQLARHFEAPSVPEFAREYIENLPKTYEYHDVEKIARKQIEQYHLLQQSGSPYVFLDTWLIITKIWFDVVFDKFPSWLEATLQHSRVDLFLICHTDLPWVPDPVRENGGKQREILQQKYIDTIKKYHFEYRIVKGKGDARFHNALHHLKQLT